ncbi:DUF4214 domain-containing protein [Paraburkholderia sp. JPY432]|uniref:beta strand repeat-containing protein n=1 Tax=Paraburkholderia youngii TaxID=2782701 RepID=UPI0015951D61|nr:DUF4214 domain-containing protein [Paraburkholderia youngii]NVH73576.1 DUF4214 domain-containing protein [Paraburkholderia youngii]
MAAAQYYEEVQQAYLAYYGRPADPAGQEYWAMRLDNAGGNLSSIINEFGTSTESTALYGGSNLAAQITAIYQTLFGRAPDAEGLNFYQHGINTGEFTLASVALNIYYGATGTDKAQLDAKQAYADAFTNALSASVSAQIAYSGTTASNNARAAVAAVTDTASEGTAVEHLDTTLANINAGAVGQTVTLTTGVDTVTVSGNGVVNGVIGANTTTANTSTFSAGDKVAGTGANNTLNLVDVSGNTALPGATSVSGIQTVNLTSASSTNTDNFTNFAGLTALNVTETGGAAGITAAGTTAVTLNDSAAGGANIVVQGGSNVTVNATQGATTAGSINVGYSAVGTKGIAATGAVTVNETVSPVNGNTGAAINVNGGTTITVNETVSNAVNTTVTQGAVTVTGSGSTTSVTVNQAAKATASAATNGTPASLSVAASTGGPGVQGVTAVTSSAAATAASAGKAGVNTAAVTVTDVNYGTTGANTIADVTLNNYSTATINDNALTTLSATGGGNITLNNATAGLATPTTNSTLNLTVSGVGSASSTAVFNDTNSELRTLNVTTGANKSYIDFQANSGASTVTTLNVSGTGSLTLGADSVAALTTLAVSGSASLNAGDVSARGAALSLTTTSSGTIKATLDAATQTFTGSTGQDVITITTDATKAITGGSATNNEIILKGTAATWTAANTGANVTGFSILGINDTAEAAAATFDLGSTLKGFSSIDVLGYTAGKTTTFANVAQNSSVTIEAGDTATAGSSLVFQYADNQGSSDAIALTVGAAANTAAQTVTAVTLEDANGVGIATVNLTSVTSGITNSGFDATNTITTLTDNGLSTLNFSGAGNLVIGTLSETTTQATAITINNTSTSAGLDTSVGGLASTAGNSLEITKLVDANIGTLTFTGSGNTEVGELNSVTGKILTIANTGTGAVTVADKVGFVDVNLTSLTLTGDVSLNANSTTAATATGATSGVTVSGASDNAHVNINLSGAVAGKVDSITLGNGNNYVTDGSTDGTVKVAVGTGYNLIDLHTGSASTYSADVTLGAHTSTATLYDQVNVGVVAANAVAANTVIHGTMAGDVIGIADLGSLKQASTALQTQITAQNSFASALAVADASLTAAHSAVAFQYLGNTYVVESVAGGGTLQAGDTVVELVGSHTVAAAGAGATVTNHAFALAS